MQKASFIESLYIDKKIAEEINFNPYYQLVQTGLGREIRVNGRSLLSLGSNDYLGIANSSFLKHKAIKALEKFGLSLCGTPAVANFLKQEDALAFPSCDQCNLGIFQVLANKQDIIIADREIHSSQGNA